MHNPDLPFVSVLCPTCNRQNLIPLVVDQFLHQNYPTNKKELIILDDSEKALNITFSNYKHDTIRYIHYPNKLKIGKKRNEMMKHARGTVIVWFDDDDVYHVNRILLSVEALSNENVDIIGVKSTLFYNVDSKRITYVKHNNRNYTCNNVLAHRNPLQWKYDDDDKISEERSLTNNFKLRTHQYEGLQLCIHMCHTRNTACKSRLFLIKNDTKRFYDKIQNNFRLQLHLTNLQVLFEIVTN